jgi:MFS superfamily sulfate permease-like transporter
MAEERMPLTNQVDEVLSAAATGRPLDDPRALQILTTEHWSLLATRSLSWSESFSRAGLFLSVLSATAVALALVAQATSFGSGFVAFALVMLPVDLFIGLATFTRLDEVNGEDAIWVVAMNRLRHAYLEIGPGLGPYFTSGTFDDDRGIEATYGIHRPGNPILHWLVTMPGMVAVIDAVLAGLITGLLLMLPRIEMVPSIGIAVAVALAVGVTLAVRSRRGFVWLRRALPSRFPSGAASIQSWDSPSTQREDRGGQPLA